MKDFGFAEGAMIGMARSKAAAARGEKGKVFGWDRAARRIVESGAKHAAAGLAGDWSYTGGDIWDDGKPVPQEDTYTYLASLWATPELELDGVTEDCYVSADETEWNSGTYWPESALAIIRGAS